MGRGSGWRYREHRAAGKDAKQELGRVIAETPKGTPGVKSELRSLEEHNKKAAYTEMGVSHKQAANYQAIARHPEAVERAKAIARENNDIGIRGF
jgi:hypothetical protein